ncbi:uncharacterized protein LOC117341516 [Pecten maximus]|uniref:uncharacterized protein LOC117341516 n=1 Tax=Pecten maximus TaxID=6579 RepID=UPI00145907C0|nr:uncharacterized protein LOC117341516 [Pecten maximus]
MPSNCCCVPECHERGGHLFPSEKIRRDKWIVAIKRLDETTKKLWEPSKSAVVCKRHFTPDDYVTETIQGQKPLSGRLKSTAVPSIFSWKKGEPQADSSQATRTEKRTSLKRKFDELCQEELETSFAADCQVEIIVTEDNNNLTGNDIDIIPSTKDSSTQTDKQAMFSVEKFEKDNEAIHYYTGLETYAKFMMSLHSLGPAAFCLNYVFFQVQGLSVPNQYFMTLMKLRRYTPNFELSRFFGISENSVRNIVFTWILFMFKQWKEISIWPAQSLVYYFSPNDFKQKFPTTRAVLDGTEFPIKKPSSPRAQQATFSTYKNRNTMKSMIGCTPGGLINFISPAYCGSTSDRQIVERSDLKNMCNPGDSLMADKGFNVQDIFAPRDVTINIPSFFKKKNRMSGKAVIQDRKISSKRVHIERIIGLGKTYKILTQPLTGTEAALSSEIVYICYMLCNFRSRIVSSNA